MKKLFLTLAVVAAMSFATTSAMAQDANATDEATIEQVAVEEPAEEAYNPETDVEGKPMHYALKQKFIEGGVL